MFNLGFGKKKEEEEPVIKSEENVQESVTTPVKEQSMQEKPMQTKITLKNKLLTEMLQMPIRDRNTIDNLVNTALESLRKLLFEKFRYTNESIESDYTFKGENTTLGIGDNRFKIDGSRPDVPGKFKGFKHNFTIILSKIRSFAWTDRAGKGKFDKQKNMKLRDLNILYGKIPDIIKPIDDSQVKPENDPNPKGANRFNVKKDLEKYYFQIILDKIQELNSKLVYATYEERNEKLQGGNKTKKKKSKKNSTRIKH